MTRTRAGRAAVTLWVVGSVLAAVEAVADPDGWLWFGAWVIVFVAMCAAAAAWLVLEARELATRRGRGGAPGA